MARIGLWRLVPALAGLALLFGCASPRGVALDTAGALAMTLADLRADPATGLGPLTRGEGQLLLHVPAGESIPVRITVQTPFATLEEGGGTLRFPADAWLLLGGGGAWLSPDGARWAPIHDGEALKELWGARHGTFQLGFGARPGEAPRVDVRLGLE